MTFVTPPSPSSQYNCSGKLAASFRLLKASYFWFLFYSLFCRSCFETFTLFDGLVFVYFRKQKWSDFRHSTFTILAINCSGKLAASWRLLKASRFWFLIYPLFCRACFETFTLFDCAGFVFAENKLGLPKLQTVPSSPILAI